MEVPPEIVTKHHVLIEGWTRLYQTLIDMQHFKAEGVSFSPHKGKKFDPQPWRVAGYSEEAVQVISLLPAYTQRDGRQLLRDFYPYNWLDGEYAKWSRLVTHDCRPVYPDSAIRLYQPNRDGFLWIYDTKEKNIRISEPYGDVEWEELTIHDTASVVNEHIAKLRSLALFSAGELFATPPDIHVTYRRLKASELQAREYRFRESPTTPDLNFEEVADDNSAMMRKLLYLKFGWPDQLQAQLFLAAARRWKRLHNVYKDQLDEQEQDKHRRAFLNAIFVANEVDKLEDGSTTTFDHLELDSDDDDDLVL